MHNSASQSEKKAMRNWDAYIIRFLIVTVTVLSTILLYYLSVGGFETSNIQNRRLQTANTLKRAKALHSGYLLLSLQEEHLELVRNTILNVHYTPFDPQTQVYGAAWPDNSKALSMAGQRRLDNFASLVAMTIEDNIPGDVIETGVWRGGAAFLAAKTIEVMGEANSRKVYLCDSFKGIPPPPPDRKYDFYDHNAQNIKILNQNNADTVRHDAKTLGLDMSHLRFVVGYFNESLPELVKQEPDLKFSVIRLDGDTYFSTMDALKVLYPRLQPGGFIIVDDYQDWPGCHDAINTFRKEENIVEPIVLVAHKEKEVSRGIYWRKGPLQPDMSLCTSKKKALVHKSVRPRNSYNPPVLTDMPIGGPPKVDALSAKNREGIKYCADQ